MENEKEERRGFRVTDRRRFAETGEAREDAPARTAPEPPPAERPTSAEPAAGPAAAAEAPHGVPVNFSTFVLGLSTQALLHLGEIPNPMTNAVERDLEAAKHVIDILGILQEKTRNNLDAGEENLLSSVLYDLRMRYVDLVRES
jgi:uncharacterized protein DUF1844